MRPPSTQDIAAIIGAPCLVQKDRMGRALFISDYARHLPDPDAPSARLTTAGYLLRPLGDLTLIDWPPKAYQACYDSLPLPPLPPFGALPPERCGLCRLLQQHPAPYTAQDSAILAQALRWFLLPDDSKLLPLLSHALADALREHRAPPYSALKLLIPHS